MYAYCDKFEITGNQERYEIYKSYISRAILHRKKLLPYMAEDSFFMKRLAYLDQFRIDSNRAYALCKEESEQYEHKSIREHEYIHQVSMIDAGFRRLTRDNYGREHSNFSNLPKSMRKCLTHNRKNIVEIDMPACQPHMLLSLLKNEISPESRNAYELALAQDIYTQLGNAYQNLFGETDMRNRDWAKSKVMYLFFGRVDHEAKIAQVFNHCFPEIYSKISDLKIRHGYKHVAHALQWLESELIRRICRKLTENKLEPLFTVYDCIAVPETLHDQIRTVFLSELHAEGFHWISA